MNPSPGIYSSERMTSGYARWRPPVHARVMEMVRQRLTPVGRVSRALDVGCGAGLSTAALEPIADTRVGLEPVAAMLRHASVVAPGARMLAGRAENLPFRDGTFDLIAAAGSLNYVDLDRFFREARRVSARGAPLVVYDFGPGRSFTDSAALDAWYAEFERRYPFPQAARIEPDTLGAGSRDFRDEGFERFAITLTLTPDFYVEYALTETSVSAAVERGEPEKEIREWCLSTIPAVFDNREREILFRGYIAYLRAV